ncbi:MAG: hypothetical protein ACMUHB_07295 [Thermoplasmatota archaeon]
MVQKKVRKGGGRHNGNPTQEYLRIFQRNLHIKDLEINDQIIASIKQKLSSLDKVEEMEILVSELGDPAKLARDLSNPDNWVMDMGTPLNPKVPIDPYFSRRGRIMIAGVFILGLILSFLLLTTFRDVAWTLSGTMVVFFAIWIIGSALLNTYLGYLSTFQKLKRSGLGIEGMKLGSLKKQLAGASLISVVIMLLCGAVPAIIEFPAGILSIPLSMTTLVMTLIGLFVLNREGSRVLEP